ncbi:fimbrial protein [Serratia plymuthica]|uniref:fimbrial protein n=1 Tax=Serratia plymuthica TaxID=82996 RepID=UPI003DA6442B
MFSHLHRIVLIIIFFAYIPTSPAVATINCDLSSVKTHTLNVGGTTLTLGNDMNIGQIIYRLANTNSIQDNLGATCITTGSIANEIDAYSYLSAVPQPLSATQVGQGSGAIYETGHPGIGLFISDSKGNLTTEPHLYAQKAAWIASSSSRGTLALSLIQNVRLVKTGPVQPGSIDASQFPTISAYSNSVPELTIIPSKVNYYYLKFSGLINIVSGSCETPNFTVDLGKHKLRDFDSSSTTNWVDSSITLTNCPQFFGYYPGTGTGTGSAIGSNVLSGITSTPESLSNIATVKLAPAEIIDPINGIIGIDADDTGNSASGVGIQLAWGNGNAQTLVDFNQSHDNELPKTGNSTIKIPLVARYIKTGTNITQGIANGHLIFTIKYK